MPKKNPLTATCSNNSHLPSLQVGASMLSWFPFSWGCSSRPQTWKASMKACEDSWFHADTTGYTAAATQRSQTPKECLPWTDHTWKSKVPMWSFLKPKYQGHKSQKEPRTSFTRTRNTVSEEVSPEQGTQKARVTKKSKVEDQSHSHFPAESTENPCVHPCRLSFWYWK